MFSRHQASRIELSQDDVAEFERTMQEVEEELANAMGGTNEDQQQMNLQGDFVMETGSNHHVSTDVRIGYSQQESSRRY
ncbi:hypothetical protein C9374_006118 [Naegleria lovaniensis]|uniref:Uncharacterized protein n=1 Tax=Naegleria lovaniensis TaxID=51637 RepID=A0AA88GIS0_NAELO|nr:uncharacterized protein C9374_006118 [Naegleria lovaniensis]KAG2381734.1 hypothetical protein C9374_006118 [Naegleria lovaniensis]